MPAINAILVDAEARTKTPVTISGDVHSFISEYLNISPDFKKLSDRDLGFAPDELLDDVCAFTEDGDQNADRSGALPYEPFWVFTATQQAFTRRAVIIGCTGFGNFFSAPEDILEEVFFLDGGH